MINDLATYFVNQSVRDYKQNINRLRRQLVNKYLDFYAGDNTDQYIISHFKSEAFQEIPPISFNITRRFIDRMSRIYTLGAQRNVNTTYDNLVVFKDFKMKHIEKMTRLLGTLAIQIRLVDINTMPHFEYNPIYNFDCYFADDDPFTPIAIVYPVIMPIHDKNNMKQRIQYAYWDNMHFVKYDEEGTILEKVEHGLGVLPFAFTHREHQLDQFFSQGAYDLIACNQSINILFTEMALGMRFQMFGQYAITGIYQDEKIQRTGSDELLILPEGADFDIKSPKANVIQAIELAKSMIDLVAQNNHLYVTFAQDGGEVPSGIALKIKDLERFEDYQDDIELWRLYEHRIYHIERAIAKFYDITLPETIGIDFKEPDYPKTTQDEIAMNSWLIENDMTTKAQLLVKYNKDLTIQEAEQIITDNRKINAQTTEQQAGGIFSRLRGQTAETE